MLCKECKEPLEEGRRVCRNCGTRNYSSTEHSSAQERPKTCKDCGEDLKGRRICAHCGARHFTARNKDSQEENAQATNVCLHCKQPLPEGRSICRKCRNEKREPITLDIPTVSSSEQSAPVASTTKKRLTMPDPLLREEEFCEHCHEKLIKGKMFCASCGEKVLGENVEKEAPVSTVKNTKLCTNCGGEILENQTLCGHCGEAVKPVSAVERPSPPLTKTIAKQEKLYCIHCGGDILEGKAFCGHCGEAVKPLSAVENPSPPPTKPMAKAEVLYCIHCGSEIMTGKTFCGQCGESTTSQKTAKPVAPVESSSISLRKVKQREEKVLCPTCHSEMEEGKTTCGKCEKSQGTVVKGVSTGLQTMASLFVLAVGLLLLVFCLFGKIQVTEEVFVKMTTVEEPSWLSIAFEWLLNLGDLGGTMVAIAIRDKVAEVNMTFLEATEELTFWDGVKNSCACIFYPIKIGCVNLFYTMYYTTAMQGFGLISFCWNFFTSCIGELFGLIFTYIEIYFVIFFQKASLGYYLGFGIPTFLNLAIISH